MAISAALALVLSYLLGSVPSAIWLGKGLRGVDVRQHGSGNAGATNVFRVLGWEMGLLVFLADAFKGWLAAGPVASWGMAGGLPFAASDPHSTEAIWRFACGLMAVLGHLYPVFAGFKGGKGVATMAGLLVAITPVALAVAVTGFVVVFLATRYVALGSLAAGVLYPLSLFVQRFALGQPVPNGVLVFGVLFGTILFYTHRTNIARLRAGIESKIDFRATPVVGKDP